jgi:dihydropyrimidinase
MQFDLIVRGGTVVTERGRECADVAVVGGRVEAIAPDLPTGGREIDATGKLVLPGGVDAHCHIEQLSGQGIWNADDFHSATVSAAFGGTTTVVSFAAQHRGQSLRAAVEDYHARAAAKAVTDYAFHMIVSDPSPDVLERELPALVESGHASIKVFTTYPALKLNDEQLLDVFAAARRLGAMVCVHAENDAMLQWTTRRLLAGGHTAPKFHAISHPRAAEIDAIHRLITISAFLDQPVVIFHVSTEEGLALVRRAKAEGVRIYAETCPQYLLFTRDDLDRPELDGAKWMFSPPPRTGADQAALWAGLAEGVFETVTSDHAPYFFDARGKLKAGPAATFKEIANGIPGLELRLPLLFTEGVGAGRITLEQFVRFGASEPARLYGLHPRKGDLMPGADADLAVWDPDREVEIADDSTHDATGYTPYAGRRLRGWPVTVVRRGEVVVADGACLAAPATGVFLPRAAGPYAARSGHTAAELDPAHNFGADLL